MESILSSSFFFFLPLFIVFFILFIYFKEVMKMAEDQEKGEICYAIVSDIILPNIKLKNGISHKVELLFINPITLEENIDVRFINFDNKLISIDSYLLCRYYKNNLFVVESVSVDKVPSNISNKLKPRFKKLINPNIEFNHNDESVIIDGIKYKKKISNL